MKTWRLLLILLAVPGVAIAQAHPPAATAVHAPRPDVTPRILATIVRALSAGDVPALAELYRHPPDPATRVLAAMALERIHHHLAKASEDARVCEHALIDSQPRIAYFCALFANGNLRLSSGEAAADRDERDIARRFADKVSRAKLRAIDRYLAYREKVPPLEVARPSGTFEIPLGSTLHTHMPTIEVKANGVTLPLIVDTGSSYITLDAKWAHKMGVHMTGRSGTGRGLLSHGIDIRYGTLDTLTFAGVTMQHVPVTVVPGRHRLIGIDVLRHLGTFRLARDKITVYGRDSVRPACRQPMLIGSDIRGRNIRLLTSIMIDGDLRTVLVDSGFGTFLSATRGAMDELQSGHNTRAVVHGAGARKHHARTNRATAQVVIAKHPFTVTFPVFKDARIPWDYVLGSGALRYMDFYFDFENAHTCMLVHDAAQ